jgi:hypothetical protein
MAALKSIGLDLTILQRDRPVHFFTPEIGLTFWGKQLYLFWGTFSANRGCKSNTSSDGEGEESHFGLCENRLRGRLYSVRIYPYL